MAHPEKREKALFVLILFIGAVSFVWLKLEVLKLGFEHQDYLKQKKEVLEKNKQLTLEYANLLSPSQIEQYAKKDLGLVEPTEKQIRYIK
ncbi:MAG: cell division protein FtsL [Proteobacteria bacterium]|nr:cell division protein FtsL [Pseudomonadota bacterium]